MHFDFSDFIAPYNMSYKVFVQGKCETYWFPKGGGVIIFIKGCDNTTCDYK